MGWNSCAIDFVAIQIYINLYVFWFVLYVCDIVQYGIMPELEPLIVPEECCTMVEDVEQFGLIWSAVLLNTHLTSVAGSFLPAL